QQVIILALAKAAVPRHAVLTPVLQARHLPLQLTQCSQSFIRVLVFITGC
ncbi:hypothetical protein ACDE32_004595, partial [Salmonella enterica]